MIGPLVLIAGTILVLVLIRRCADGRIGVNPLVGIRTPLVMSGEETWLAAHRAALPIMQRWCIPSLVLAVLAVILPWDFATAACMVIAVVLLLIGVARGSLRGIRAARSLVDERD